MTSADETVVRVGVFGLLGSGNLGNDGSLEAVLGYLRTEHPEAVVDALCGGPEAVAARYGIPATRLHWYRGEYRTASRAGAIAAKGLGKLVDVFRTAAWVRRHDVVIVPGMGVLEATLPLRPWGFPYALFLLCASGRLLRTRVALVSVGADGDRQPADPGPGAVVGAAGRLPVVPGRPVPRRDAGDGRGHRARRGLPGRRLRRPDPVGEPGRQGDRRTGAHGLFGQQRRARRGIPGQRGVRRHHAPVRGVAGRQRPPGAVLHVRPHRHGRHRPGRRPPPAHASRPASAASSRSPRRRCRS